MLGCLGVSVLITLLIGGTALVAWIKRGDEQVARRTVSPASTEITTDRIAPADSLPVMAGRMFLDLGQGEFTIQPAEPGETTRVEAVYDEESYELVDSFEFVDGEHWIYRVSFRRTTPGLYAFFHAIMGGHQPRLDVYIDPDAPVALAISIVEGGAEVELGGLWITSADFTFKRGGFSLSVDEPLREPMERMRIHGSMGGFEAMRLGNASPRALDIKCSMGGADIDLRGDWLQDAEVRIDLSMGGADVRLPRNVTIEEGPDGELRRQPREIEAGLPTLRLDVSSSMGEVSVRR
jgi:hypothetical protein